MVGVEEGGGRGVQEDEMGFTENFAFEEMEEEENQLTLEGKGTERFSASDGDNARKRPSALSQWRPKIPLRKEAEIGRDSVSACGLPRGLLLRCALAEFMLVGHGSLHYTESPSRSQ